MARDVDLNPYSFTKTQRNSKRKDPKTERMSALTDLNSNIPQHSPAAVGYFVDQKKGEVNELKQVSYI